MTDLVQSPELHMPPSNFLPDYAETDVTFTSYWYRIVAPRLDWIMQHPFAMDLLECAETNS